MSVAQWHVLYTKPREEQRATDNLRNQGYTCFLPTIRLEQVKGKAITHKLVPLFPRYVFIQMQAGTSNWVPLRSTKGVAKVVEFGGTAARVPDALIDALQAQPLIEQKPFQPNDAVRIASGAFAGFEGVFQKLVTTPSAEIRAMILLEFLHKTHAVLMPVGDVRAV